MTEEWMRRKFAGVDTVPLFEPISPDRPTPPKRKPVKNAGRAECPDCGKSVGLYVLAVRDGFHRVLGYRKHWRRRPYGSGTYFICPKSNTEASEPEGGSL